MEEAPVGEGSDALFLKEHFAMTAALYASVLNTLAHGGYDESFHLYTEKIASIISRVKEEETGLYHYTVLEGQESTLLGYLKCLDPSKLQAVLCKNEQNDYNFNAEFDTDKESYLFIKIGATEKTPQEEKLTADDNSYYSWFEESRQDGTKANYYWFNKSVAIDDEPSKMNHYTNGELWVSLPKADPSETFTWNVLGDKENGVQTVQTNSLNNDISLAGCPNQTINLHPDIDIPQMPFFIRLAPFSGPLSQPLRLYGIINYCWEAFPHLYASWVETTHRIHADYARLLNS